jgi:hypothetical protein
MLISSPPPFAEVFLCFIAWPLNKKKIPEPVVRVLGFSTCSAIESETEPLLNRDWHYYRTAQF